MVFQTGADLFGTLVGLVLTLFVFSYLLGDNAVFRFTVHLFVGVSAGLAAAIALRNVIVPHLLLPLLDLSQPLDWLWAALPAVLGLLLLAKLSPRLSRLGNVPTAFIVGVGAAAAVGGAVLGTLFPQVAAATSLLDLNAYLSDPFLSTSFGAFFNRVIAVLGTVAALIYFQFGAQPRPGGYVRHRLIEIGAQIGQVFIAVTFGVLFSGVFMAALAALVDRVHFFSLVIETVGQGF
jgi:hypothetical protein